MALSEARKISIFVLLGAAPFVACQRETQQTSDRPACLTVAADNTPTAPRPVPDALLDQSYTANRGLLKGLKADGTPATDGPDMDPLIAEARRYYETVRLPVIAARGGAVDSIVPDTLDEWKQALGFEAQRPGEDRQTFRKRTGVVVYYNRNELALGRELGCVRFTEEGRHGEKPSHGVACYVANYGHGFGDSKASLGMAIQGTEQRNTVCIIYRPSLGPGFEIQFYVFGASGRRQEWAQLDTLGARPHPMICMNCHGGDYDSERHLAMNARFLPLDPDLVDFPTDAGPDLTRVGQEERIRAMNALAVETPLTPAQQDLVAGIYANAVRTPGQTTAEHWVPEAWRATTEDHDFYDSVVKPYCATCHLAAQAATDGRTLWSYKVFQTPTVFNGASLVDYVCEDFSMPNAQPTTHAFWDTTKPVTIAGRSFPSAADAFLAHEGIDRSRCPKLQTVSRCDRGPNPDRLCGDDTNGLTCDHQSGRCINSRAPTTSASL